MGPGRPRSAKVLCAAAAVAAPLAAGGCLAIKPRPDFDSAFAPDRHLAIEQARARGDRSAVDDLIRQLSDDDLLLRWSANDALVDLTGHDAGFEPDASERERRAGIDRWMSWRGVQQAGPEDAG
ncbi:MAG: hypothetical protein AAGF47_06900 [Planctomycetota bacterium]